MLKWTMRCAAIAGGGLLSAAILWWALVYYGVFVNTGTPLTETAPCLVYTSDMCSLAMALCGGRHLLGITRYSAEMFWFGLALASVSLMLGALHYQSGTRTGAR
jgi:hypothetical protein